MRTAGKASPAARLHMAASQDRCLLLQLPPELRNRIYDALLLLRANEDGYAVLSNDQAAEQQSRFTVLSILGTCQQTESEAMGLFYAANRLRVRTDSLSDFVGSLGYARRHSLRHLACDIDTAEEITGPIRALAVASTKHIISLRLYVEAWAVERVGARFGAELCLLRRTLPNATHLQHVELVISYKYTDGRVLDYESDRIKMAEVQEKINALLKRRKNA
ncbi:hypothetical protein LTR56_014386 [Elasticomyces elasticus]|nr:hypothetical protein LTR22_023902 [Elasticomyces elasticus]KAK3636010.1 hypothetical protein LTR56_014386 [Elasticomyces elasticus]KAK4916653.1 hypothetical protein LTR49_015351 [Elasticomyces elasticus]KAK5754927.1 hypothetical protein LTS12_014960 [Elasticomyces elasticus]